MSRPADGAWLWFAAALVGAASPVPAAEARSDPRAERAAQDVMAMSEKDLLALVPAQCPDVTCACPKCAKYVTWRWTVRRPFQIQCAKCGSVYPNDPFPIDKSQTFLSFIGEEVKVPYHQGRKPKCGFAGRPNPERYFLDAPIHDKRYGWLVGRALPRLVAAYQAGPWAISTDNFRFAPPSALPGPADKMTAAGRMVRIEGDTKGQPRQNVIFHVVGDLDGNGVTDILQPSAGAALFHKGRGEGRLDVPARMKGPVASKDAASCGAEQVFLGDYDAEGLLADLNQDGGEDLAIVLSNGDVWVLPCGVDDPPAPCVMPVLGPGSLSGGPAAVSGWDGKRCLGACNLPCDAADAVFPAPTLGPLRIQWQEPGGKLRTREFPHVKRVVRWVVGTN
jgi:hypothetical protein